MAHVVQVYIALFRSAIPVKHGAEGVLMLIMVLFVDATSIHPKVFEPISFSLVSTEINFPIAGLLSTQRSSEIFECRLRIFRL